jgi:hypothetical protein
VQVLGEVAQRLRRVAEAVEQENRAARVTRAVDRLRARDQAAGSDAQARVDLTEDPPAARAPGRESGARDGQRGERGEGDRGQ